MPRLSREAREGGFAEPSGQGGAGPARGSSLAVGGQAVIEGVMMRGARCLTVAVRRPDGQLVVREGPLRGGWTRRRWARWPGIRGVAALVDAFATGYGALRFSLEQQVSDEERAALEAGGGRGAMLVSVAIAIAVFVALPQGLTTVVGWAAGVPLDPSGVAFHAITGAFKLGVLLAYLALVGRVEEMGRVFAYHGAEHKTIHAFERGLPLDVAHVRRQPKAHPRCGTTLLVTVVLVGIVAGSIVTPLVLQGATGPGAHLATLGLRIAILPLVAAVSYELQRLGARFEGNPVLGLLLAPGLLVQSLTTREPDDAQIEVAIAARESTEWCDAAWTVSPPPSSPVVRVFEDLESHLGDLGGRARAPDAGLAEAPV